MRLNGLKLINSFKVYETPEKCLENPKLKKLTKKYMETALSLVEIDFSCLTLEDIHILRADVERNTKLKEFYTGAAHKIRNIKRTVVDVDFI